MAKLTNTQIQSVVNEAYKQFTGDSTAGDSINLKDLCDLGTNAISTNDRERFTGALIGVLTKNWFTDTSYRGLYVDPFYEDAEQFGAIMQAITVEVPEAKENSAWKDFVSGTSKVGEYTVYLPVVDTKYYTKSSSWAIPITITGEQWDTAFHNENELSSFVAYVFMMVDNALIMHMENMNSENRNFFMANKIKANADSVAGVHVVDLVGDYVTEKGITTAYSVETALMDREFLAWASGHIAEYISYFKKPTKLFNTEGKLRFTPENRLVCQLLDRFVKRMESVGYANTFHEEYIQLPNHQSIPWWQTAGDLSFDDISSLHILSGTDTVCERSGVVGLLCDKWAVMHTIRSNRVGSQHFGIEDLTHYEYQHRDSYMNNLTMNAVVFVMNDHTVS